MKVIRADFKTVGIQLVDERGHRVDFHALRMTYITRLQRAGVSPREAMELARHSDMRLTMKTYTDAAQLPLAATVRGLPSFDDSQTLVADRPAASPAVIGLKAIKAGKAIENIDESHGQTPTVATCHSEQTSGDLGFESTSLRYSDFSGLMVTSCESV